MPYRARVLNKTSLFFQRLISANVRHDQLGIRKRNFILVFGSCNSAAGTFDSDHRNLVRYTHPNLATCTKRSIHRGCLRCQLRSASTHRSQSETFVRFQSVRDEGAALDRSAHSLPYRSLLDLRSHCRGFRFHWPSLLSYNSGTFVHPHLMQTP